MINNRILATVVSYDGNFIDYIQHPTQEREGEAYDFIGNNEINGSEKLTFSLPLYILNEKGEYIENPKWKNLNSTNIKIRIKDEEGTTKDFVITNYAEAHDGNSKIGSYQCQSLAEYELSKIGWNKELSESTLNIYSEDTDLTDPDIIPVDYHEPDVNFWMTKALDNTDWTYEIESYYNLDTDLGANDNRQVTTQPEHAGDLLYPHILYVGTKQFYEKDRITSYLNGNPIYSDTYSIKKRIISSSKSSVFNIVQDICEKFEVYPEFIVSYDENGQIIGKKIILRNELPDPITYSINYEKNISSLSRAFDANNLVTKMYVSDIENSNNDNGVVSIRNAEKNKMGENYLLNFDWFLGDANIDGIQSKNLIPEDLSWTVTPYYEIGETGVEGTIVGPTTIIDTFKDSVSKYNKDIKDLQTQSTNLQKKIENLTGEYNYQESSYNAALTTKNQEIQKLKLIPDEAINKVEKKYAYLKNDNWILSFSSQGVKDTSIVLHADDGTEIAYEITKRDPIVRFSVLEIKLLNVDLEWTNNSVMRVDVEYVQSTKSFLEYLITYYQNIIDGAQERMTRIGKDISFGGLGELAGTQTTLALVKTNLKNRTQSKQSLITSFEKIMSPFIREGYWEDTSYATYVKQEEPISSAYPTNNLFKTSELEGEDWTKFTDSLRDVFLIPNTQLKTLYTDEGNSANNKYLWLYDVIDLDTIEVFDKDSNGEYNQYSNTEFSVDYAQARIAAETTPSFAKGIYIWFLKDYSNPENTYLEHDNIYIRFKLRGQNEYYEAIYDAGEFYLDLLKLNSDKFGNPPETAENFISVCPIEMTYKINAANVVSSTVSIELNTIDPVDLLSLKTYQLTYGYDYTVAKIEDEVEGTIETIITFVNKNVLVPLILNQNNLTNYTIRYQTDTTEGYYYNDAETKMSENCVPQVDYQINTIDLSKTLVESQERIIEEEAGTIITGTDIAITDNTKPTGRITGFECASTQVQTTTGKNLLDTLKFVKGRLDSGILGFASNTTSLILTRNNITMTTDVAFRGCVSDFIPVNSSTIYSITASVSGLGRYVDFFDINKAWISRPTILSLSTLSFTTTSTTKYVRVSYQKDTAGTITVSNQQLELGTATTYEQFIPNSPSVDYPSPILSTGDNGILNVLAHKKNYFNVVDFVNKNSAYYSKNVNDEILNLQLDARSGLFGQYIPVKPNTQYTITTTRTTDLVARIYDLSTNNYYASKTNFKNSNPFTFTTNSNGFIAINFVITSDYPANCGKIGIKEGTDTTYEPYTGVDYPITLPVGYLGASLPNGVKDTATMKNVGKIVLNGSESGWGVGYNTDTITTTVFEIFISTARTYQNSTTIPCMCDKLLPVIPNRWVEVIERITQMSTNKFSIRINRSRLVGYSDSLTAEQKIALLKTYLASNNVTVYYELATPVPITLTLPKIATYQDYTAITTTNAVKPNLTLNYNYVPYQIIGRTQTELQNFNSEFYKPKIGARALINDKELKLKNVVGIITSLIKNYSNPSENSIVIANYKDKFKDLFQRISASTAQIENNGAYYEKATKTVNSKGQIPQDIFKETILNNDFVLSKTQDNLLTWGSTGIVATDRRLNENGVYGQLRITSGGIFVADSKDENGNYNWKTGITPSYINADLLTAGTINTKNIKLYNDDYQRFLWDDSGIHAYKELLDTTGKVIGTDFDSEVKFNQDGLVFKRLVDEKQITDLELGWEGLKIGAQGDILKITSTDGLEVFQPVEGDEQLRIQIGTWQEYDETTNKLVDLYGIRGLNALGAPSFTLSQNGLSIAANGMFGSIADVMGTFNTINQVKNSAMKNGKKFWLQDFKSSYAESDTPPLSPTVGLYWYCTSNYDIYQQGTMYRYEETGWVVSEETRKMLNTTQNLLRYTNPTEDDRSRKYTISNSIIKMDAKDDVVISHIFNTTEAINLIDGQEYLTMSCTVNNSLRLGLAYIVLGFTNYYVDQMYGEIIESLYEPSFLITPDDCKDFTKVTITTKIPTLSDIKPVYIHYIPPEDTTKLWLDLSVYMVKQYVDGAWSYRESDMTVYNENTKELWTYRRMFNAFYPTTNIYSTDLDFKAAYPVLTLYTSFNFMKSKTQLPGIKGLYWGEFSKNYFHGAFNNGYINTTTGLPETSATYPNSVYSDYLPVRGGQSYVCSGQNTAMEWRTYKYDLDNDGNPIYTYTGTINGNVATITGINAFVRAVWPSGLSAGEKAIIQVEDGTVATAYEPYSNGKVWRAKFTGIQKNYIQVSNTIGHVYDSTDTFVEWEDTGFTTQYIYDHPYQSPPYPTPYGVPFTGSFEFADLKVEYNNIASGWSPYPGEIYGKNFKVDERGLTIAAGKNTMFIDEDEIRATYDDGSENGLEIFKITENLTKFNVLEVEKSMIIGTFTHETKVINGKTHYLFY